MNVEFNEENHKMKTKTSVEFIARCMSLSPGNSVVTFRTKIRNWKKTFLKNRISISFPKLVQQALSAQLTAAVCSASETSLCVTRALPSASGRAVDKRLGLQKAATLSKIFPLSKRTHTKTASYSFTDSRIFKPDLFFLI